MEKINTDYKRRTEKFRLNFSSRSSFDTLQHFTVSRTEVLLLCHDCYWYIIKHWFTRYTYKLKSKILPDQSIEFFFSFTGTYVSNGWTQLDSYTSQCSDEELECMLAAFSCFTFQAELCAVPYLVEKKNKPSHNLLNWDIFSPISNVCNISSPQAGHMSPSVCLFVLHFASVQLRVFLSPFLWV